MQPNRDQPSLYRRDSAVSPTSADAWPLERWLEELGLPDNRRLPLMDVLQFFHTRMPWVGRPRALWYMKGLDFFQSYFWKTLGNSEIVVPFRRTRQIPYCFYYARIGATKVDGRFRAAFRHPPQTALNSVMPRLKPLRLTQTVNVLECRYTAARDTWIDDSRLLSVLGCYATQYIIAVPPAGWGSQSEGNTPSPGGMDPWVLAGIVPAAIATPLDLDDDDRP